MHDTFCWRGPRRNRRLTEQVGRFCFSDQIAAWTALGTSKTSTGQSPGISFRSGEWQRQKLAREARNPAIFVPQKAHRRAWHPSLDCATEPGVTWTWSISWMPLNAQAFWLPAGLGLDCLSKSTCFNGIPGKEGCFTRRDCEVSAQGLLVQKGCFEQSNSEASAQGLLEAEGS